METELIGKRVSYKVYYPPYETKTGTVLDVKKTRMHINLDVQETKLLSARMNLIVVFMETSQDIQEKTMTLMDFQ